MENEVEVFGRKVVAKKEELAHLFSQAVPLNASGYFERSGMPMKQILSQRAEFFQFLGECLYTEEAAVRHKVLEWTNKLAALTLQYNISLTDSLRILSCYQPVVMDLLNEDVVSGCISPFSIIDVTKKIDRVIDLSMTGFGKVHEEYRRMLADTAYSALEELSVPVVPVAAGVVIVPLVGAIDTRRAALIKDFTLSEAVRLKAEHLILDISGVAYIDTMVTHTLFKVINMLELLGIKGYISGISPAVAQTVNSFNIQFTNIRTVGTLRHALEGLGIRRTHA